MTPSRGRALALPTSRARPSSCRYRAPRGLPPTRARGTRGAASVHLAAGLRLREALAGDTGLERSEAIVDPRGRVVHAEGRATTASALERLRAAALAVDRARARSRPLDAEASLELWQALFAGRWTIVERFDSLGRRFLVAYHNEPEIAADRALTRREQQVVALAATGHGDDDLGYALGLRGATVRTHLARALAKLGLPSRAALLEIVTIIGLGPAAPPPVHAALPAHLRAIRGVHHSGGGPSPLERQPW